MKRFIITFFMIVTGGYCLMAQDLNARVQLLSPQVQNTNKQSLTALETLIKDFLNNRRWSNDNVKPQERIDCSFIINVTTWDGSSNFTAEAQIQSSRPVYGTAYNSTILNISDKDFNFNYSQGQPLDYSDQAYITNLSSMLAFYAYVIVGLDRDTFSKFSGTPYYLKARNVVTNAQNASFSGWKAYENLRNKFWLAENLNNKIYNPLREVLYDYHRQGLDVMYDNQSKGRRAIFASLPELQNIDKQKQGSILNQAFFTAKADEIVNIAGQADPQERVKLYNLLAALNPPNISKYELLKK